MLRMRKGLEKGLLSEDLLPLITSAMLPKGSSFMLPLNWYYSKMNVNMISMRQELVYLC